MPFLQNNALPIYLSYKVYLSKYFKGRKSNFHFLIYLSNVVTMSYFLVVFFFPIIILIVEETEKAIIQYEMLSQII